MQAPFILLQASCLIAGPGMCGVSMTNHHAMTRGAHPGGAAIGLILRVRLRRGPASRREPESHGTLKCNTAQGSQNARPHPWC